VKPAHTPAHHNTTQHHTTTTPHHRRRPPPRLLTTQQQNSKQQQREQKEDRREQPSSQTFLKIYFSSLQFFPIYIKFKSLSQPSSSIMLTDDEEIVGEICNYAESHQIKAMLQEYLKRLILAKPDQPIHFLQETIKTNPYVPSNAKVSK
jgi:hypothetical protein